MQHPIPRHPQQRDGDTWRQHCQPDFPVSVPGVAVASAASAAIGALSEDSSIMGKALIFVALAESIALYGLLISFPFWDKRDGKDGGFP